MSRAEPRRAEPRERPLVGRGRLHPSRPCGRRSRAGQQTAFRFRILDPQRPRGARVRPRRRRAPAPDRRPPRLRRLPAPAPDSRSRTAAGRCRSTLAAPGAYRAFADFEVDGDEDRARPRPLRRGRVHARSAPCRRRTRRSADGFEIALTHAALHANEATKLHFAISRNGGPSRRSTPTSATAATSSRSATATSRTRTSTPSPTQRSARSSSTPSCRPPAATACSCSSRSTASSTPHRSRSRSHDEHRRDRAPRAADRGDDLRLVRRRASSGS